jgi:hypothetical protein
MSAAPPDLSKRAWLARAAGLSVAVGATTLAAGCLDAEGADLGAAEDALSGSNLGWTDAIGTAAAPLDLRTLASGAYAVVIARGFYLAGDGGGGIFEWTTDTGAADDGGLVVVPTASPRTGCWKRLRGAHVDVRWFGARGDGTADDRPAIQRAIDACAAASGGTVLFPRGTYRTTAALTVSASNVILQGIGNASSIRPVGSFDTIVVRSTGAIASWLYGVRVLDLHFDEQNKTGGRLLYANFVAQFVADRVFAAGGWNGMEFDAFNNVTLNHPRIESYRGGTGSAYLRLTGGGSGNDGARSDVARVQQAVFGGTLSAGMKGLDIDGFVHTVNLFNVHFVNIGAEAVHIRNCVAATLPPTFITADDLECDYPQYECVRIDDGLSITLVGALLNGSRQRGNVYVGEVCRSVTISGGFSSGARQAGIAIAGRDVCITGVHFKFNSSDQFGGSKNSYPGILIGGQSRGVVVTGCRSGEAASANFQRHGIQMDTGADEFCVTGNVFTNNATGGILNGAGTGASKLIASNVG